MNNPMDASHNFDDFPADDASQRALVGELYEAIRDFSQIRDTAHMDKRRKRQGAGDGGAPLYRENHQVRRVRNLSPIETKILAWDILVCPRLWGRGALDQD